LLKLNHNHFNNQTIHKGFKPFFIWDDNASLRKPQNPGTRFLIQAEAVSIVPAYPRSILPPSFDHSIVIS
jgi:hypothetical protein